MSAAKTPIQRSQSRWKRFWFRPISAAGFGMMRVSFGFVTFFTMAVQWPAMERYYGPAGIIQQEMVRSLSKGLWRFSLIDYVSVASAQWMYVALLIALFLVAVGVWTRLSLFISIVLLYSFHEYGTIALDGGDTTLRLIGLILLVSPCDRAFTITNLWRRFSLSAETGKDQPPIERTMPIWPYRLLLWQITVLYVASTILKLQGVAWRQGSAVAIVLHHDMFRRITLETADLLSYLSPLGTYFTLLVQAGWGVLMLLGILSIFGVMSTKGFDSLKRALLLGGIIFHASIGIFLDVGTFSFVMFTAYLGLLLDNDFKAIREVMNRSLKERVVILFDGRCGFCSKVMITLRSLDWLHRLEFQNYHDPSVRKKYAPNIDLATLDRAMHVRKSDGSLRAGFYGFRVILGELPLTWFFQPIFFFPGIANIGERVYEIVAEHRPRRGS